jgi:hypothetical protein
MQQRKALQIQQDIDRVKKIPQVASNPTLMAQLSADPINTLKFINENMALREARPQIAEPILESVPTEIDSNEKTLPSRQVVANEKAMRTIDMLNQYILNIANSPNIPTEIATKETEKSVKQIEAIRSNLAKEGAMDFPFDRTRESIPPQSQAAFDSLRLSVEQGIIDTKEFPKMLQDLYKKPGDVESYLYAKTEGYTGNFEKWKQGPGRVASNLSLDLRDPARQAQALSENSSKYVANKNVSESFEIANRFNNFTQAYNNPQAGGASDAVLIYSMAKMLDPGGAVQQGDIGTIAGQKSIPERLQGIHQQFVNSRILSNEQRENLNAMAFSIMKNKRKALEPVIKQYRNYATSLQSPDPTADVQNPFENIELPKSRVVTINQKRTQVRLGNDGNYYYTDPQGKNYIYND